MRYIPDEAMDAFCEGADEENAKPENNTPSALARHALGGGPFNRVSGPHTATIGGESFAFFGTREGIVLMRNVAANGRVSVTGTIAAAMDAVRHPDNLLALHTWLDSFDGDVPVRVYGVPLNAKVLHRSFVAFSDAPTCYGVADVTGVDSDGLPVMLKLLVLDGGGTIVGIAGLVDAKRCVAAWPIPDGVRE